MTKKGEFLIELRAEELGLSLERLAVEGEAALQQSVADAANAAFAAIQAAAQKGLHSTLDDYRRGLNFQKIGNDSYLISLEGEWPNALEKGYGPFSIRERMLRSSKTVEVGPRAGQPWVQRSKDGHKFAHVPFEHQPFSKTSDLAGMMRKMTAINSQGQKQKLTKIFRDINGRAVDSGSGKGTVPVARADVTSDLTKNLIGMVKYQRVSASKTGKEVVQSIYHTYRTVSEAGKDWIHPGFAGLKAFDEAERAVAEQLDQILKTYLEQA